MNLPFRLRVPLGTAAIGIVALWGFLRWNAAQGAEDTGAIRTAENALALGHAFRARQEVLAQRAKTALESSRTLERAVSALRGQLQHAPTIRDTVRIQVVLIDSLTAQRDSLTIAEAYQRARAERAESRVALLESNLRSTLTVADCRLLGASWLPRCPSRNLTALLGLTTGALAVL